MKQKANASCVDSERGNNALKKKKEKKRTSEKRNNVSILVVCKWPDIFAGYDLSFLCLSAKQQLHRAVNSEPSPEICHAQRLSCLLGRKSHFDDAVDCFFGSVLVAGARVDGVLALVLLEDCASGAGG